MPRHLLGGQCLGFISKRSLVRSNEDPRLAIDTNLVKKAIVLVPSEGAIGFSRTPSKAPRLVQRSTALPRPSAPTASGHTRICADCSLNYRKSKDLKTSSRCGQGLEVGLMCIAFVQLLRKAQSHNGKKHHSQSED